MALLATSATVGIVTYSPIMATVNLAYMETLQPFLQAGSDKGDYVLPGTAATYPWGGLHARYYNDADLQADTSAVLLKTLAPSRSQAYAGSGSPEYINQQDTQIAGQTNPTPGAANSNWSCKWFGAIYLKLSAGNYSFTITNPSSTGCAVRVWIGKTKYGDQVVDQWSFFAGTSFSFTVSASALAGSLPYGAGSVQRDGWYPIKIEYAVASVSQPAPTLTLTNSPAAYTDPGGTSIASGSQSTPVPATSLSPLGCVDNRFQGVSHYDLVQKTTQAFGYQFSVEPYALETGLFPGVLAPRIREGADYALDLEPDDTLRRGDALTSYSSSIDGTDQASSVSGNGAGFQNGTTGQLQGNVFDSATLATALFDMQAWQDNADASFSSLLQALLNSELSNRLAPWQIVSGDPSGRDRMAQTWPLSGAVAQMRWRPGDGVFVKASDINVNDTTPRQLLLVTRQLHPNGLTGTQVGFAGRPKSSAYAARRTLAAALRPQRNYQKSLVTITGTYYDNLTIAASGTSGYSLSSLAPGDTLVRAKLRINYITGTSPSVGVAIVDATNTVQDVTTLLKGPWTVAPVNLDITGFAGPDIFSRLAVALINKNGSNSVVVSFQILVDVLR